MYEIITISALILLNGLFSMSEMAVVSARKSKLALDAENGDKAAGKAAAMAEDPDNFLSTIQIGITLIGILTGLFSGAALAGSLAGWLSAAGIPGGYAHTAAQAAIVAIVTYLTLVFGELLPKRIGLAKAEAIAKVCAGPMLLLSKAMTPFVKLLSGSTALLFRVFGLGGEAAGVTEAEIKAMVKEGAHGGEVQPEEQNLVEKVFLMGDLNVDSIMTQRCDIVWIDINMDAEEIYGVIAGSMHELYPVADGSLDRLKGAVTLKQLVLNIGKPGFRLADHLSEPPYFYENTKVFRVVEHMRERRIARSIIVDEFGACVGIVSLKDIVETLFGSLPGEQDEPQIVERAGGGWFVDGSCTIVDFLARFGMEGSMPHEDFNTVAGLCINQLGRIPKRGDVFEWNGFSFEVADMDMAKIDTVIVQRHGQESPVKP